MALSFGQVSQADRSTAQAIKSIVQEGGDTGQHADPAFRHQLAYVVQDTEKALRGPIAMPAELRIEMFERAGSAPGLENERMQALMRSTSGISDRTLVRDIRSAGIELGSYGDQNLPGATSNIETLENRVRLTARTPDLTPTPEQGANTSRTPSSEQRNDDGRNNRSDTQQQTPAQVVIHRTAADVLIDSMRGMLRGARDVTDNPPWEPEHKPMKARFEAYQARLQAERDGKSVARAEQNGQAALDALNGFQNNEGAGIMSRIREAARNNPGGLEGVLSEMKPGGRFADLRTQFTAALDHDHGFAAAYDKAATALAQYDKSRTGVDPIIARAPEADKLAARFEGLDAKIGEAASLIPGKQDGKSMVEDLSKMIGDIFQRAVDGVRSMFNRAAGADATARPGPSPGMS